MESREKVRILICLANLSYECECTEVIFENSFKVSAVGKNFQLYHSRCKSLIGLPIYMYYITEKMTDVHTLTCTAVKITCKNQR